MRLNKNLKGVLKSSVLWTCYEAITAGFLIVFALALGASNTIVGIFGALPYVATLLTGIPGAKLVEFFTRKQVYVVSTGLSRLVWLLIIITPYLFKEHTLLFVGSFYFVLRVLNHLADPAWTSWIADLIPEKTRGRYWAQRNMLTHFAGMVCSVIAGAYLDLFPKESYLGFATLFGVGIILGLLATRALGKTEEPEYKDHDHHSIKEFFKIDGQFRTYSWIRVFFNFSVMIASPFFTVYMLKNLGLSYTQFVSMGAIMIISRTLANPHFGEISDRIGDRPVLFFGMLGTALVPLLFYFITPETIWLIIPAMIINGFVWAAEEVAAWNMFLDLTSPGKRVIQAAEFGFLNSFAMILGPVAGGLIADKIEFIIMGIPLLFLISTILRGASALLLIHVHESRTGPEKPAKEVFTSIITFHPLQGIEHAVKVVVRTVRRRIHPKA